MPATKRILVTGVTGFAGSHLVDYMLERGDSEIYGIQRWRSRTENIEHFPSSVQILECDLRDATSTRDTLEKVRPEWIFHLAAQSFVPTSWIAPSESLTTNVMAQVNIFEAVRHMGLKCRIQLACSSEEYGSWANQRRVDDLEVGVIEREGALGRDRQSTEPQARFGIRLALGSPGRTTAALR